MADANEKVTSAVALLLAVLSIVAFVPGSVAAAAGDGGKEKPPAGVGRDTDASTAAQEEQAVQRLNQEINRPDSQAPDALDRREEDLEMPGDDESELDELLENE